MISATSIKYPLPVVPVDGMPDLVLHAQPAPSLDRVMRPLDGFGPAVVDGSPDMTDALRDVAFQTMLDTRTIIAPLPVLDRSL